MGEKLTKLCCSMGIPVKEITREQMEVYKIQKMEEDSLIKSMTELDKIMNGNVIVMGGFCACSQVLGFRRMRRTSNDLDCVTDEEGIKSLFNFTYLDIRSAIKKKLMTPIANPNLLLSKPKDNIWLIRAVNIPGP